MRNDMFSPGPIDFLFTYLLISNQALLLVPVLLLSLPPVFTTTTKVEEKNAIPEADQMKSKQLHFIKLMRKGHNKVWTKSKADMDAFNLLCCFHFSLANAHTWDTKF